MKFSEAGRDITRIFLLSSEIIARALEGLGGHLHHLQDHELVDEFMNLESETHAVSRLRNLTSSDFRNFARTAKLFILVNYTSGKREGEFFAEGFQDNASAAIRYTELEGQLSDEADVVLVGASQQEAIKLAYTNYFSDASGFISALDRSLDILSPKIKPT